MKNVVFTLLAGHVGDEEWLRRQEHPRLSKR